MSTGKKILQSVAVATTLTAIPATAAIIHTDPNPDVWLYNISYDLDLNNDSIADFNLTQSRYSSGNNYYSYLDFTSYNNNSATLSTPLSFGDTIDGNTLFEESDRLSSYERIYHTSSCGKNCTDSWYTYDYSGGWNNVQNGYLGLQLNIGGETYYGWADLDVYSTSAAYLREYAFEDWANTAIGAGFTVNPNTVPDSVPDSVPDPVPEPSTVALLAVGFAGLVAHRRSKVAKK